MRQRRPRGERKTICSKCKKPLEESRAGKQSYCKGCHAEYMRRTRPKHRDLPEDQRKKANARAYTKEYVKRGTLVKKSCEVCGDDKSEIHHPDYDKPLEVIWLCRKHHLEAHKQ
jgi:hypothetical protein